MNYYPHHIGDYLRDTSHLSAIEDGIYRRMLDLYYASEKPLPIDFDWMCKLLRVGSEPERESAHVVLHQFFSKFPDGWHNKRADEEIKKARKKAKTARANGKKGGRPKTQRVISGIPRKNRIESSQNQTQTQNQSNTPIPPEGGFESFWKTWPAHERKQAKGKCYEAWMKQDLDSQAQVVIAHVESLKQSSGWRQGYVPAPLVYLNQRRWEGAETQQKEEIL